MKITLSDGVAKCNCAEKDALGKLVHEFSKEMTDKLCLKADQRWGGWCDESNAELLEEMHDKLRRHVKKPLHDLDNLVDIANFKPFRVSPRSRRHNQDDRKSYSRSLVHP